MDAFADPGPSRTLEDPGRPAVDINTTQFAAPLGAMNLGPTPKPATVETLHLPNTVGAPQFCPQPSGASADAGTEGPPAEADAFVRLVSARPSLEINPHLWKWQAEALDLWHGAGCRGVIEAVTGAGKTMIGITAAFEAFRQGVKVLVLVPTAELQTQWQQRLLATIPQAEVGTLGNGRTDSLRSCDILVAIINSATRTQLLQQHSQGMLIADECHRYAAKTFSTALNSAFNYRLGLTATYRRPDNAHQAVLDPYFGGVVFQMCYDRALEDGVIAEFDIAFVGVTLTDSERGAYQQASATVSKLGMSLKNKLDMTGASFEAFMRAVQQVAARKNDQSPVAFMAHKYLDAVVKRQTILTNARHKLSVLDRLIPIVTESHGTLVFSQTVDASTQATEVLMRSGVETRAVASESTPHERRGAMQLFANGYAKVLCAPRILDEGIDVPDADLAIVLSGSKQPRQTIQRLGRIIRRKPDSRHGRFVVLYARNTIEDEQRTRDQQFGQILPAARRIADFDESQIRELRKFLRDAESESPDRAPDSSGSEPASSTTQIVLGGTSSPGSPVPIVGDGPEQSPQTIVLRKDDEDEPPEQLTGTASPDDPVGLYLAQIQQFPLLSAEEEVGAAQRIEAGLFAEHKLNLGEYLTRRERHDLELVAADGRSAFNLMVSSNLRLVVSIAKKYKPSKLALLDLVQEGNLGLVRAVQKFDFTLGNKFSTYATWWIRQAILRAVADHGNTIRLPVHLVDKVHQYWRCTEDDESRAACTHDHASEVRALRLQPQSLDAFLEMQWGGHYAEISKPFDDRITDFSVFTDDPEDLTIEEERLVMVDRLVDTLSERGAEVIRRRFGWIDGEPQTLDAIGQDLKVTRERIRQIEKKALDALRARVLGEDAATASCPSNRSNRRAPTVTRYS